MTVRDAVIDFLRSVGVDAVFGNPGSTELRMLRDWPGDLTYVLGLQESVVVATAAGYAIGTGRAAFVSLHSAGGVGHALGSVFTAYRDRVPLLILAGQQTREMLPTRPFLAADEPAAFPRPYVKWSAQPSRAEDVPAALAEAYRVAMTPPRGPVFLSVPEDDWDAPAEPVPARDVHADFVGSGLPEVAEALTSADRPALVIGAGVDQEGAQDLAVALAERTRAAVWIGPMSGRSGFPEDHRLFQGFLPPVRDRLAQALTRYDVVVSLGAPVFRYHVHADGPFLPPGTRLFQLDCDPADAAWAPVGTSVLTTVKAGLAVLADLVGERDRPDPPRRPEPEPAPDGDPLRASYVIDTLRRLMPPDAVLVEEAPSHREVLHRRLPVTRPGGFLTTGSGSLGWGLPLAVGRALAGSATGERVVCLLGDGSTMYSVQALWTAARHRVPVTFVVLNNHGYAAVRQLGERLDVKDPPGTEIEGIDFAGTAAGLGCPGHRVTGVADLEPVLRAALAADGPVLVEVPVAADEPPGYVRPPGA